MERLLRRYEMMTYLTGSPINSEDLDRASASNASACFILCDRRAPDQMKEDSNNILRALAVRKHSRRIPIFAQVRDWVKVIGRQCPARLNRALWTDVP